VIFIKTICCDSELQAKSFRRKMEPKLASARDAKNRILAKIEIFATNRILAQK
jgi:hypothetical protein